MISLLLFGLSIAGSKLLDEELQELLKQSTRGDYSNDVTCKRPSVKTMIYLWESNPVMCVNYDEHEYLSVQYTNYLTGKGSEIQSEFMEIWGNYLTAALGKDSWRPISGTGVNDKSGTKHMIYNNLDSSYVLGTKEQYNVTLVAAIENQEIPQNFVNVHEFITDGIGGLISMYHLQRNEKVLKKIAESGENLLKAYANWYPYTLYDFEKNIGKYEKIPMKALVNVAELYMVYHYTKDSRYKDLLNTIEEQLKVLLPYEVLPEFAVVNDGKIEFHGMITAEFGSAEVGKILYTNWLVSNKTANIYKEIYDKTKQFVLKKLPFSSDKGQVVLAERNEEGVRYRMNLKMCLWSGILAAESNQVINTTELDFAQRLLSSCFHFFKQDSLPADYLYLEKEKMVIKDKAFSIPSELFESLYYVFKATHDSNYRKLASYVFSVIKSHCKVSKGYSMLGADQMPQDFLSKSLKFLFLMFDESRKFSQSTLTFSGHFTGYI